MDGDIGVGEMGPTPQTRHNGAARRHLVEVPNLRDTFDKGGGTELLEERPPDSRPQGAFALPTPGELRIPCLIFTPPDVQEQLKNLLRRLFRRQCPTPSSLCSTPPRNPVLPQAPEAQCSRSHQQS